MSQLILNVMQVNKYLFIQRRKHFNMEDLRYVQKTDRKGTTATFAKHNKHAQNVKERAICTQTCRFIDVHVRIEQNRVDFNSPHISGRCSRARGIYLKREQTLR